MQFPDEPLRHRARIVTHRALTPAIRELILEKDGLRFRAGHELLLHGPDPTFDRQYSIASGEQEETLTILYRVIPEGKLTPWLAQRQPGESLEFTGPLGSFLIRDFLAPMVFVATGTGIAPARSFIRSHPELVMTVLHGVRHGEDLIYRDEWSQDRFHACVSGEDHPGAFPGRVTGLLQNWDLPLEAEFYLCGANDMILDVRRLLKQRGIPDAAIHSEAYYFW